MLQFIPSPLFKVAIIVTIYQSLDITSLHVTNVNTFVFILFFVSFFMTFLILSLLVPPADSIPYLSKTCAYSSVFSFNTSHRYILHLPLFSTFIRLPHITLMNSIWFYLYFSFCTSMKFFSAIIICISNTDMFFFLFFPFQN